MIDVHFITEFVDFIKQYVKKGGSPLCGNTIHQDRKFLVKYMPKLEGFFHYRKTRSQIQECELLSFS